MDWGTEGNSICSVIFGIYLVGERLANYSGNLLSIWGVLNMPCRPKVLSLGKTKLLHIGSKQTLNLPLKTEGVFEEYQASRFWKH